MAKTTKTKAMGGGRRASGADGMYRAKNYLFVIAINDYEHIDPLNNCVSDAEAVIRLLTEDFEFERSNVRFICSGPQNTAFADVMVSEKDENGISRGVKATSSAIHKGLMDLGRQITQDQTDDPELKVNLLLYYSGHGWYDEFLDQGYWIPVDSELDDYSKYISNSTIRDYLSSFPTHHTLLLADSCFSGSLFASGASKSLASTRLEKDASRWGITAGRNEVVSDGKPGERSPFIDSLLTELRANDTITVQDLSTKILERVASDDNQTPRGEPMRVRGHKGGQFVFRKKANARKHFTAGKLILRLAKKHPEYARYRAAATQFDMAGRLSKKPEDRVTYLLWELRALSYAGLYKEALQVLKRELRSFPKTLDLSHLHSSRVILQWLEETASIPEKLAQAPPPTGGNWGSILRDIYRKQSNLTQDCHLLVVAINDYPIPHLRLNGCINDAQEVSDTLQKALGAKRFQTRKLYDDQATKANIVGSLKEFAERLKPDDVFFFYFCGHASNTGRVLNADDIPPKKQRFLVPFDIEPNEADSTKDTGGISAEEFHQLLEQIPCQNKVIILDTNTNDAFLEHAQTANYSLLQAAGKGEQAKELRINGQTRGIFSYYLTQFIVADKRYSSQELEAKLTSTIAEKVSKQTPVFFRTKALIDEINLLKTNAKKTFLALLRTLYGHPMILSEEDQLAIINTIDYLGLSFSAFEWKRLAQQLKAEAARTKAIAYFHKSLEADQSKGSSDTEIHLELARLYGQLGQLPQAHDHLAKAQKSLPDHATYRNQFVDQKARVLSGLNRRKKYALLIGIDAYEHLPQVSGVDEDLQSWQACLAKLGYKESGITILRNEEATKEAITEHLRQLAAKAVSNPAFFFFAGHGTAIEEKKLRGFYPYDGKTNRFESVLWFEELAAICEHTHHLTTVLDTGFDRSAGGRRAVFHGLIPEQLWAEPRNSFGNGLFIPGSLNDKRHTSAPEYHFVEGTQAGVLSSLLTRRLRENPAITMPELLRADTAAEFKLGGEWLP